MNFQLSYVPSVVINNIFVMSPPVQEVPVMEFPFMQPPRLIEEIEEEEFNDVEMEIIEMLADMDDSSETSSVADEILAEVHEDDEIEEAMQVVISLDLHSPDLDDEDIEMLCEFLNIDRDL